MNLDKITDADVIAELQAGTMLLKKERYALRTANAALEAKLKAAEHDYAELMKERTDYVAENKKQAKIIEAFTAYKEFIEALQK